MIRVHFGALDRRPSIVESCGWDVKHGCRPQHSYEPEAPPNRLARLPDGARKVRTLLRFCSVFSCAWSKLRWLSCFTGCRQRCSRRAFRSGSAWRDVHGYRQCVGPLPSVPIAGAKVCVLPASELRVGVVWGP